MNDLISVIIPVYHTGLYINKCLSSVSSQTYGNLELLCVIDGDFDNSCLVMEQYTLVDDRVVAVEQNNKGQSSSRNTGKHLISGEWVTYVDSDDWIDLHMLESMLTTANCDQSDAVMCSFRKEFSDHSVDVHIFQRHLTLGRDDIKENILRRLFGPMRRELRNPQYLDLLVQNWAQLYRSDILFDIEFIDSKLIGTEDLLYQVMVYNKCMKFSYIRKPYYHYRKTNLYSITSRYRPELFKQWINQYILLADLIIKYQLEGETQIALKNRIGISVFFLLLDICTSNLSFTEKRNATAEMLRTQPYRMAVQELSTRDMRIEWRVIYFVIKKNLCSLCVIICELINAIRRL
ncbi:putative glycosyltransferase EpsH [Clostridia bacterium]|nr:putative glycosyltransferase EpsH [Clostridia bacterium]